MQRNMLIFLGGGALLAALAGLHLAERHFPVLSVWIFLGLTLTLGMGHGALDAALLVGQFKPYINALAYAGLYLGLVISSGWLLSMSIDIALIALILMSVWHFGELHASSLAMRLVVGGASVMVPVLVSNDALAALVKPLLGGGQLDAWWLWSGMAMVWLLGLAVWLIYAAAGQARERQMPASQGGGLLNHPLFCAAVETLCIVCLNLALSPLLAFSLYFGLWHSVAHMARVQRAVAIHRRTNSTSLIVVIAAAVLVTAALLALLWWWLAGSTWLPSAAQLSSAPALQWLVVALAAVTLPHLLLVGYSRRWLGR